MNTDTTPDNCNTKFNLLPNVQTVTYESLTQYKNDFCQN